MLSSTEVPELFSGKRGQVVRKKYSTGIRLFKENMKILIKTCSVMIYPKIT